MTFLTRQRLRHAIIGAPRLGGEEKWGPGGVYYYEWKNNQLRQVHFTATKKSDRP